MTPEERIAQIQEALQRRFRAAGHGSIQRVQEALNLGPGYFKDQRRPDRRRIDLRVLFRALEELGVRPADLFADALGSVDPLAIFLSRAAALRRRDKPPRILALEQQRTGDEADRADLSELDGLERTNPRLVLRRAHALVRCLEDRQVPKLLGIYASTLRLLGRLDEAQIVLAQALTLAAEPVDPRCDEARSEAEVLRGELLQRASQIAADRGDHREAVALSEKAALAYVAAGHLVGIGKTLVDQGIWLADRGRLRHAIRIFEGALDTFPPAASDRPEVRRHRASCLKSLGASYRELGELEDARRYAAMAREHSEGTEPVGGPSECSDGW